MKMNSKTLFMKKVIEPLIELRCSNMHKKFKKPCGRLLATASGLKKGAVINLFCHRCNKRSQVEFL